MHEYYIGNWENAKQDQHQSAHHIDTNKGGQALAQPMPTHKELAPGPLCVTGSLLQEHKVID